MAQQSIAPIRCLALSSSSTSSSGILSTLTPAASTTRSTLTYYTHRTFTTTSPTSRQKPTYLTVPTDLVPAYPYGRFETYKQRNAGLYGRSKIRFGNVVAEKYKNKSRTSWLPNRHTKRLWSPSLNAFIRTRLTANVLSTIDRLGGIDEYLLGDKAKRVKELGPAGWALRWKIIQTPAVQARFARQRRELGLPPREGDDALLAESDAATGTDPQGFPAELAAHGLDSQSVLDEVDAMIERDEEFVLGEPATEAEIRASHAEAQAAAAAQAEATDVKPAATQAQKPE
ncbi:hypothetical protein F5Y17DRAFT_427410 [Xylariaceae sp. FL0594]|nr:hypothetical protein F5Y17DRAFT_427410 [Xylariaceae sp. FL0594]